MSPLRRLAPCLLATLALACSGAQRTTPSVAWRARSGPALEQLLNVHRAWSPSPTPDGQRVTFLSDASGLPLAYTAAVGAEPSGERAWQRLIESPERVQYAAWSPDGRHVLFGQDTGGDENTRIFRVVPGATDAPVGLTAARVKTLFGAFNDSGSAFAFTSNERSSGAFDVYVRDTAGDAAPRRVLETGGHIEAADFSPDGARLVAVEERSNFDTDLHLVPAAGGAARRITAHTGDVRWTHPHFSRDGRALFVVTDEGREFMNLAVLPLDGDPAATRIPPVYLHEEAHDVDLFEASREGGVMAAVFNVDGYSELRLFEMNPAPPLRERPRPRLPPGNISAMAFTRDGRYLFCDLGRAVSPDEVWRVDTATGAVQRVTAADHAGFTEESFVEPTLERARSFDGLEVPFFLFRPRGLRPGERAPVVVWVHGGPEAQFTPYFSPVIQYLVGNGYAVAAPNVRGSTGYGKRYAHLDDVGLREDSVRDLGAVNQWLRGQPFVRPDRIAVMGGSYGGYMTLAAITLQPELWAAACDIVGIANFRTFLERTAPYRRALREAEYGSLARDGEVLDRVSPIHRVDRIRAPLFVIHGANDPRVPVQEAEQIVAALRARNQRVEYVRFENEGHGIFRRENKVRAYGQLVRFFNEVLGAP